jgi:hypothetical protein
MMDGRSKSHASEHLMPTYSNLSCSELTKPYSGRGKRKKERKAESIRIKTYGVVFT